MGQRQTDLYRKKNQTPRMANYLPKHCRTVITIFSCLTTIEHCKDYFFRLFAFDAVLDETLAARDVDVELALLLPLTALTCLFYETIHVS